MSPRARKRRAPTIDDAAQDDGASPAPSDASDDVGHLLAQIPQDVSVHVYKRNEKNQRLEYCAVLASSDVTLDGIRDEYGPGFYRLLFTRQGHSGIIGNRFISIAPAKSAPAPVAAAPAARSSTMDEMMQHSMLGMLQMQQAMMTAIVESVRSLRPDPDAELRRMAAMRDLVGPREDPVTVGLKIAELTRAQSAPAQSIRDQIDALNALRDLADTGDGGGSRGPFADVVRSVLPMLPALLQAPKAAAPAAPALPSNPPERLTSPMSIESIIVRLAPQLAARSAKGGNADAFAEVVLEDVPRNLYPDIHAFVTHPDAITQVLALAPALAAHRNYLSMFLAAVSDITAPSPDLLPDGDASPNPEEEEV